MSIHPKVDVLVLVRSSCYEDWKRTLLSNPIDATAGATVNALLPKTSLKKEYVSGKPARDNYRKNS